MVGSETRSGLGVVGFGHKSVDTGRTRKIVGKEEEVPMGSAVKVLILEIICQKGLVLESY